MFNVHRSNKAEKLESVNAEDHVIFWAQRIIHTICFFSSSSLIGGHSKWCLLNNTVYNIYAINKMWWNYHPNHSNIVSRFVCCLFVKYTLCSILLIDWFMSSMIWSTFDEARLKPVIFYNFSIKSSNPLHSIKKWMEKKDFAPEGVQRYNDLYQLISKWYRGEKKRVSNSCVRSYMIVPSAQFSLTVYYTFLLWLIQSHCGIFIWFKLNEWNLRLIANL